MLDNCATAGPAAGPAAAGPAAVVEEVEEKKEEIEAVDMGGLFGGDDDDYWAASTSLKSRESYPRFQISNI